MGPIIWNGLTSKILTSGLQISNFASIYSGNIDPSSVATNGKPGDIFISSATNVTYTKQDTGVTTNWLAPGSGNVSSVAFSVPTSSIFSVAGSPVTTAGTLQLITSGTSGGIPYFSDGDTLSSSDILAANQLVLGGGSGQPPTSLAAGTQYQSLVMGASSPTYDAVHLDQPAAVTGVLPNANTTASSSNISSSIVLRDLNGTFDITTLSQGNFSTKAATTAYVDVAVATAVAGINPAVAVQAATVSASDTSSLTYDNGTSGVGATFTGSIDTPIVIDGFTFDAVGQRLLVKDDNQGVAGSQNGIFSLTQLQTSSLPPIFTRVSDYNAPSNINSTGAIPVVNGTVNGTTSWVTSSQVNTVGTDPITFTKFTRNPNDFVDASSTGNLTEVTSSVLNITGGTNAVLGDVSIEVKLATSSQSGYLSSDDFFTFASKQPAGNYITALTGDITASGPGSVAATLKTVNSDVGSFVLSSITVNEKGLVTAASSASVTGTGTIVLSDSPTITTPSISGEMAITGSSDAVQLTVKGNSTQTTNVFEVQNSSGTTEVAITNTGTIQANEIYAFGQGDIVLTAGSIYNSAGTKTLDWFNGYLNASNGSRSIDWFNRALNDGVTGTQLSWTSAGINLPQLTASKLLALNGSKVVTTMAYGNLTEATSSILTITGGSNAVLGTGTTIQVAQAGASTSGYLSSTDWNTFNSKQAAGSYITALTGDVTASGPNSASTTIASIQGTTVSGTTGNGNVVFSTSAVLTSPVVKADNSAASPNQLVIEGSTNTNQQLQLGYNTTSDYGSIQANKVGTGVKPLSLNPAGGLVGIGVTSPNALFDVAHNFTVDAFGGVNAAELTLSSLVASSPVVTNSSKQLVTLSFAQLTAQLSTFVGDTGSGGQVGIVPAPATGDGTSKFLKADGTWAVPAGSVTSVGLSVPSSSIFGVSGSPITSSGTISLTTTGTSGGIPYFSSTSQLSSSGALSADQLVIGGGAGSAPSTLAAGTQYQVLTMGASSPAYGALNLAQSAAVTGILPNANTTAASANTASAIVSRDSSGNFAAGTITAALTGTASGNTTYTPNNHGVVVSGSANVMAVVAPDTSTSTVFISGGASANPGWGLISNANISSSSAIDFSKLAALSSGNILVGNGSNVAASVAMSGDVTISNTGATTIGTNVVSLSKLAQISTQTFLGRTTASTGNVENLTAAQATAILVPVVGDSGSGGTKGLVPAPAAGDTAANKFLKADGTWQTVAAGIGITDDTSTNSTFYPTFSSSNSGTLSTINVSSTKLTYNPNTGVLGVPSVNISGLNASKLVATDSSKNLVSYTGGNLTESTSSILTITGGSNAVIGSGVTIQVAQSGASASGYLSSTDWNTFNNKQPAGSYITGLTGDATASGPGSVALTLATVNSSPGSFGSASQSLSATVNGKGLITSLSAQSIQIAESQVTNLTSDLALKAPLASPTFTGTVTIPNGSNLGTPTTLVGTNITGTASGLTAGTVTTNANLTGDVTSVGNATTLATVNASPGSFGDASHSLSATVNGKGLVTSLSAQSIQITESQVTNLVSDLAGKQATGNYITGLTGDATASGPGSVALTLATVNSSPGSFGSASQSLSATVNGKGLITSLSAQSIQITESQVTNLTSDLASKLSVPALTAGSVLFFDGTSLGENNSNFFWDATNARLGLGTTVPSYRIHVEQNGGTTGTGLALFKSDDSSHNGIILQNTTSSALFALNVSGSLPTLSVYNNTLSGNQLTLTSTGVGILQDTPATTLDVNGTFHAVGDVTFDSLTASSFVITDSSKKLISPSSATATSMLDAFPGDTGSGSVKGLVPSASAGDAAANKFLKADGTWAVPDTQAGTPPTVTKYLSGSGTYTLPVNVLYIEVIASGGGAGGQGSGLSQVSSATNGGDTTFGTAITAHGGSAGTFGGSGGSGGSASITGAVGSVLSGGSGGGSAQQNSSNATTMLGGAGGVNALGGGSGAAGAANTGAGGAGATGAYNVGENSGSGGGAGGYVRAFIRSPSSTYSYSVGAAGSGGVGDDGTGYNGGSGYLEIIEYYGAGGGSTSGGSANNTVDTFDGDGTTTSFTLTTSVTTSNTLVYISGAYQNKSTYSVSGSTITFNSAPAVGTGNIEVNSL